MFLTPHFYKTLDPVGSIFSSRAQPLLPKIWWSAPPPPIIISLSEELTARRISIFLLVNILEGTEHGDSYLYPTEHGDSYLYPTEHGDSYLCCTEHGDSYLCCTEHGDSYLCCTEHDDSYIWGQHYATHNLLKEGSWYFLDCHNTSMISW